MNIPVSSLVTVASLVLVASLACSAEQRRLAVFRDVNVPIKNSAPSDPEHLARLAREAGWDVHFVSARELADPKIFSREKFEVVVLPYGESFPLEAVGNFRAFVKAGGSFFSTGGYALNHLYSLTGDEADRNLLRNPGFEDGLTGWKTNPEEPTTGVAVELDRSTYRSGACAAQISVKPSAKKNFYRFMQEMPAPKSGTLLQLSTWVRTRDIRDGFAYLALSFWRADGTRIENKVRQSEMIRTDTDWKRLLIRAEVPRGAVRVRANLLLYAFGEAWFDDAKLSVIDRTVLNTRLGHNTSAGILFTRPEQIGIFDDSYPLEDVSEARSDKMQFVIDPDVRIKGPMRGWAASAVVGVAPDKREAVLRRWTPLLNGFDESGQMVGPVLAMVYNFAPPFRGSSWAFAGVTNRDPFAHDNALMGAIFARLLDAMHAKMFLAQPRTDLYCYRQGETVQTSVTAYNLGTQPVDVRVELQLVAEDSNAVVAQQVFHDTLAARSDKEFLFRWQPERFDDDFYEVLATLHTNGRVIDGTATAFVVWDPAVIAAGFPLRWNQNYFCAGTRPLFLAGTNHYFTIWRSEMETPLAWKQMMSHLRDHGIHVMRTLHLTSIMDSREKPGRGIDFDWSNPPKESLRRLDALVQMCQKYQIILFQSLHDHVPVVLDRARLEAERKWAEFLSRRYADVPGIMYDIQNEPSVFRTPSSLMEQLYREFLRKRYRTDKAFAQAYGKPGLTVDSARLPGSHEPWDSRAGIDRETFGVECLRRWVQANAAGIRSGQSEKPLTVGFLPTATAADMWLASQWTDFSNFHAYVAYDDFRRRFKFIDQRSLGRGLSIGEFGAAMNPGLAETAMQDISRWAKTADEAFHWYLTVGSQAFGLGGSMVCNWHANDPDTFVFSWGLLHNGQRLPRPTLKALRAVSMFFHNFAPVYDPPELCYVIPDNHRNGGGDRMAIVNAIQTGLDMLIGCGVEFAVINESSLGSLPSKAKLVFWPIPFCPDDDVVEHLMRFVKDGGTMMATGDFSYDPLRQRTRTQRLKELAGVEFVGENYPNIDHYGTKGMPCKVPLPSGRVTMDVAPCIQIRPAGAQVLLEAGGQPILCEYSLGRGKTYFTPELVEVRHSSLETAVYEYVLQRESVGRLPVRPVRPQLPVLRQPTRNGEDAFVFCNVSEEVATVELTSAEPPVQVTVPPGRESLVVLDKSRSVIAAGIEGDCIFGGGRVASQGRLMLIAADKLPIAQTKELVVFLLGATELSLNSSARWQQPVAEFGEVIDGKWRRMGDAQAQATGEGLKIGVPRVHRLRILLLAEGAGIASLRETVARWIGVPQE